MRTKRYPVGEFGDWLNNAINSLPIPFYRFAEDICLSPQVIRRHMEEITRPSVSIVQVYADYFQEDFDYIYGMVLRDYAGINTADFSMWLWDNMQAQGFTVRTLSEVSGISETTIYTHLSARYRCFPSFKMVKKYCKALGVSSPILPYEMSLSDRSARSQKLQSIYWSH